jgi:hypothetical protein
MRLSATQRNSAASGQLVGSWTQIRVRLRSPTSIICPKLQCAVAEATSGSDINLVLHSCMM